MQLKTVKAQFPAKLKFLFSPHRYKIARGGRGCVHRDTLIDTPNGKVKISEFNGGEIYTFDGKQLVIAYAEKPIEYLAEDLFKVTLDNDNEIICTDEHKFLTSSGWKMLKEMYHLDCVFLHELLPVSLPFLQQSNLDIYPQEYHEDVRHCFRKVLSFLYCYSKDCHLSDVQPLDELETYLDVVHMLADGLQHKNHALKHLDDLGCESKRIHLQFSRHLSSLAVLHAAGEHNSVIQGNYNDDISSALILASDLFDQLSRENKSPDWLIQQLAKQLLDIYSLIYLDENLQTVFGMLSFFVHDDTFSNSFGLNCNLDHFNTVSIKSIEFHSRQTYFDMFVPLFNNYLSNGVINHNSAKSWSVARALLIQGKAEPLRIGCFREIQKSIKDSVHALLKDQVQLLGFGKEYEVLNNEIRGKNGTVFLFGGLADHTVESIKSFEGLDRAWIEEGQTVSKKSWGILIPTIRKTGSEIWVTYNPDLDTDETHQRFTIKDPTDCVNVLINYNDNPWFNDVLEQERMDCLRDYPKDYPNIWEGKCRPAAVGAIYYDEIEDAQANDRICNVPYDPMLKVHVIVDLGWNDAMSIIMLQKNASEVRIIDYIEDSHKKLDEYSAILKEKRYNWGSMYLPHDGYSEDVKASSAYKIMTTLGWIIQPREALIEMKIEQGIKAARMIFSRCYFDKTKTVRLVECLKRYRRVVNQSSGEANAPLHDEYSHGADAFRYVAVSVDQMTNDVWSEAPLNYPSLGIR